MERARYYRVAARKHPEIKEEWVDDVLNHPLSVEMQPDGRIRYYGYVGEVDKWIRVIVEDGKLFNRFFDHRKLREWGRP